MAHWICMRLRTCSICVRSWFSYSLMTPVLYLWNTLESTAQQSQWHLQLGPGKLRLLLRASMPHWPQTRSTWQSPPISTVVLFLATPLGEAGEKEIEWGHRTVHNSRIGNWNLCTWLASFTNSVNLSHHFLLVPHRVPLGWFSKPCDLSIIFYV